jgi:N-acyl-D-amino-acid deacylase
MLAAGAESRNPEITRLLIKAGASSNAVSRDGETAMTRALSKGHSPITEVLLSAGARMLPSNVPQVVARRPDRVPDIRTAVNRGIALIQTSDQAFLRKSGCKSCHNQSLPAMAVDLARKLGFRYDEKLAEAQNTAVLVSMAAQRAKAVQMMDPDGGSPLSGSYALVSLNRPLDDTTAAFARNIAARQLPDGRWRPAGIRPPIEYSDVSATALAIRALQLYASPDRKAQYNNQIRQAAGWLARFEPRFTEERVYQLLGLLWTRADSGLCRKRAAELLAEQRGDGGWSQLSSLESDAYATGQVLYALHRSGSVTASNVAYQRGVRFLLQTQADDGSWFVKSRAVKFQPHFEAGFPYGKDQFISVAGTSWAVMALMLGTKDN